MKNMVHNKKRISNRFWVLTILVILLTIMSFILFKQKSNNMKKQIGEEHISNYSIKVGSNNTIINFDKSIAKTREEVNAPQMGAGMIPIIDIGGGLFEITTVDDKEWYDYTENRPAYMMLSDGKYLSELQQHMTNKKLARVGTQIPVEELGTVYVWIPRFAYCENNIGFLKDTRVINTSNWETPEVFTVKTSNSQFNIELTGIWVEKGVQTSTANTDTKVNQMNNIDNTYGIIANEKVFSLDEDTKGILDIFNTYWSIENYITEYSNLNRTYIKVINTNKKTELVAEAYMSENKITIKILKNDYEIEKVINVTTGLEVNNFEYSTEKTREFYKFIVIDTKGNMISCNAGGYEENQPDLKGFRVDSTYVVTYSGEINKGTAIEVSEQPISEILKDGYTIDENNALIEGEIDFSKIDESKGKWYDYAHQKWANIVVRNNGKEAYFVWIPRYAYATNSENQTTDILFIDTDNIQPKTGKPVDLTKYTIPEAFTWLDDNGNTIQLSGYWMGKYQVSN